MYRRRDALSQQAEELEALINEKGPQTALAQVSSLDADSDVVATAVNLLVLQVFRKDDYAVKYVFELLLGDGPLGELPVRLKLI